MLKAARVTLKTPLRSFLLVKIAIRQDESSAGQQRESAGTVDNTEQVRSEVHGAMNNERHVCDAGESVSRQCPLDDT